MKTFTATLTFVQTSRGEVLIKARSLKDARRKADEITAYDVDDWNPKNGEMSVESVAELKPRKKTRQNASRNRTNPDSTLVFFVRSYSLFSIFLTSVTGCIEWVNLTPRGEPNYSLTTTTLTERGCCVTNRNVFLGKTT